MITISDIEFSYAQQADFRLGPISLELRPGRLTYWMGHNGSGKSTLARILAGDLSPSAGTIAGLTGSVVYHQQAVSSNLFSDLRVSDHFRLLNEGHGSSWEAVVKVFPQLRALGGKYPDELSGGQRQLAAFATLLVEQHRLYLFDEVLNHLDADLANAIMTEIARLVQRQPTSAYVIITHSMRVVHQHPGELYVFRHGTVKRDSIAALTEPDLLRLLTR